MKYLNKVNTKFFFDLVEGLNDPNAESTYRKIDQTNGAFMAVNAEYLYKNEAGFEVYAISHSFIQNGDVMRDPEMTFFVSTEDSDYAPGYVFPASWEMSGLRYEESLVVRDGKLAGRWGLQHRHNVFANGTWFRNMRDQQGKIKKVA